MALIRSTTYPGRFTPPTTEQPQGAFKNRTTPSSADGSFLEQRWVNDWSGLFSSILDAASITPNGTVDEVGSSQYFDALLQVIQTQSAPPGEIKEFAMQTVPTGYFEADGSEKSRVTEAALFAAIGTTYGSGDGSTTFNLPDYRGVFRRGWDHGRGIDAGRAFGDLQDGAFAEHGHTYALTGANGLTSGTSGSFPTGSGTIIAGPHSGTATAAAGQQIGGSGIGESETRPVNVSVLVCIKR